MAIAGRQQDDVESGAGMQQLEEDPEPQPQLVMQPGAMRGAQQAHEEAFVPHPHRLPQQAAGVHFAQGQANGDMPVPQRAAEEQQSNEFRGGQGAMLIG